MSRHRAPARDAKAAGQRGPAIRAGELVGKTIGAFRDRLEVDKPGDAELVSQLRRVDPEMADFVERKLRDSDPDGVVEKLRKLP